MHMKKSFLQRIASLGFQYLLIQLQGRAVAGTAEGMAVGVMLITGNESQF